MISQTTKRHGGTNPRRLQPCDILEQAELSLPGLRAGRDRTRGVPEGGETSLSGAVMWGT